MPHSSAVEFTLPSTPTPAIFPRAPRSVLVASTGGHLAQLMRLSERIDLLGEPLWVTFDTPQSRSLLAGYDCEFVPFVAPREFRQVLSTVPLARRILQKHRALEVVSTGSAVALAFLPTARTMGIPCHYIESAARSHGPSITGRVLRCTPGVRMYTQYPQWARGAWQFAGSMFDEFRPGTRASPPEAPLSVLVLLGTLSFRFDALVEAVRRAVPADAKITWQVGPNRYHALPGEVWPTVEAHVIAEACRDADVIVAHAGVGSALTALTAGKHPILLDRRPDRGEHVDGHQRLIAEELGRLGIATHSSPETLDCATLLDAAGQSVVRAGAPTRLTLRR